MWYWVLLLNNHFHFTTSLKLSHLIVQHILHVLKFGLRPESGLVAIPLGTKFVINKTFNQRTIIIMSYLSLKLFVLPV